MLWSGVRPSATFLAILALAACATPVPPSSLQPIPRPSSPVTPVSGAVEIPLVPAPGQYRQTMVKHVWQGPSPNRTALTMHLDITALPDGGRRRAFDIIEVYGFPPRQPGDLVLIGDVDANGRLLKYDVTGRLASRTSGNDYTLLRQALGRGLMGGTLRAPGPYSSGAPVFQIDTAELYPGKAEGTILARLLGSAMAAGRPSYVLGAEGRVAIGDKRLVAHGYIMVDRETGLEIESELLSWLYDGQGQVIRQEHSRKELTPRP
jgi:hypothetical protein